MFYEISGTVAQNVNIFILLHFSQEDLLFKQEFQKSRICQGIDQIESAVSDFKSWTILFCFITRHGPLGDLI